MTNSTAYTFMSGVEGFRWNFPFSFTDYNLPSPTVDTMRQKGLLEFKVSLVYIVNSRPSRATE